ncbi:ATP-binding protein [Streptococcus pasteurianus]|nr:ATP-binding protein [Streptococcus pasteurianus]
MFPIKYIDNNLVWNKDNEVFAYYELIPYNYSFLSAEQKFIVHDSFRQLIAQSREGKIHALQIATESSIRSMQEQSKKLVTGKLKEVAYQKIDEQTEALVSMIGDNQVDYRFFLGFKLMVTEEQLNLKNIKKSAWLTFTEFLHEVNHTLMNDFVSMPNDEINRYMKMEKLLENKISRRFKVRRLEINDFGYLMEHLYGRDGIAYEDYEYQLPKKKLNKETLIKYYDLIRPTRCVIEESQRYLRLEHEDKESYVSYFTVNAIVGELDFPSSEIFYFQQQQFTFPVDTSMNVEIVENRKALTTVRNKKKELKDLDNHAYQAGSETSSNVVDALDSVDELETDLDQSKESMYKLSYVIRVSAPDLDELKRRCDEVKDFYDDLNVKLVRPAGDMLGDMLGLHSEFLPASKRYINDYVQYVKSDFLAGLGFGATQQLGETTGIYMGYSVDTGRNVYLQPSLASQGIKGTVTNALASAFVGSLGGGKSFCNNLLVYYSVLFGGQAVILDPKSERGNWKETLPEIAHEINIVNLTSDKDNAGLLDPFVIMKNVKDAESLAIDILTFLTGISSRDGEKFPVLRKAVRSVTQSDSRGLLHVIDELRREDTPVSRNIADHIDSFTDYDFAHLLFSDGTVENAISLDNQLNIIQVADLVLPDKDTTFEEYTTIELLSVSMLIVISTFALDFIHSDRSIFKIVDLDEAWAFLNVAQGETLSNKLVRAGRAMQAGVYFVTQSSGDVAKESLKNNIGLKFAFRSTDLGEIKQTLEFFGIDKDDENNQKRLRDLDNGQCLLQDLYGRVGVVQIHPVFEELLHAFDTRPPVQRNEVE